MIVGTFVYLYFTYLWINKPYILVFKEENNVSCEKLPFFCIEEK